MFGTVTTHTPQAFRSASFAGARVAELRIAGALLFVAGAVILLGIISAEALYPVPYSTGANAISDLGGTEPPAGLVYQPSATIFNLSMVTVGVLILLGSVLVHRAFGRRAVTLPILVLGVGALGVGVFPGNTGTPHALFAMATFISGGLAAITAALVTGGPFRYLSILLGAISLSTLAAYFAMGDAAPLGALGLGGVERWIVYPIVLWVIGFGAYLAGRAEA
jgi:hypothetical membrane protein